MIAGSRMMSRLTRLSKVQCQNLDCGWTGTVAIEVVNTISPPHPSNIKAVLPPAVGREYFEAANDEDGN